MSLLLSSRGPDSDIGVVDERVRFLCGLACPAAPLQLPSFDKCLGHEISMGLIPSCSDIPISISKSMTRAPASSSMVSTSLGMGFCRFLMSTMSHENFSEISLAIFTCLCKSFAPFFFFCQRIIVEILYLSLLT